MMLTLSISSSLACLGLAILARINPALQELILFCSSLWLALICSLLMTIHQVSRRYLNSCDAPQHILLNLWLSYTIAATLVSWLGFIEQLTLFNLSLIVASLGCLVGFLFRNITPVQVRAYRRKKYGLVILLASTLMGMAWLQQTVDLVRYHPIDSDNMWYHYPMIAEWMRGSSIWHMETIPLIARAYPGHREAFMTFLSLPMGKEHLAIPGCLEWILLAGIFQAIQRELFVPRAVAWSATACLLTTPMVMASGNGNDLSLAIQLLFTVWSFIRYTRSASLGNVVLIGLGLGSLAATKYSGIIYAGLLVFLFLLHLSVVRKRLCAGASHVLQHFVIAFLAICLVAGPWYLRNLIHYGNPLYPAVLDLKVLRLPGELDSTFFADKTLKWNLYPLIDHWHHFTAAFGWITPLIVTLAMLFLLVAVSRIGLYRHLLSLSLLPVLLFVAFLHQPYNYPSYNYDYNMRYLISWYSFSLLSALACLRLIPNQCARYFAVLLIIFVLMNITSWSTWWKWYLLATAAMTAAHFFIFKIQQVRFIHKPLSVPGAIATGVLALLCIIAAIAQLREKNQYSADYGYRDAPSSRGWGEVARFVHSGVIQKKIVVTGDDRFFPFYGNRFTNSISLSLDTDSSRVLAQCEHTGADILICLNPIKGRAGLSRYEHSQSIGTELLARFPKHFRVLLEANGAYVLEIVKN